MMASPQEENKVAVEGSEPSRVESNSEPATTTVKKPIQLGVVQSSVGSRGNVSSSTKKSRWDQGPGPGEAEGESSQRAVEPSQTNKNVKDLVNKFEGITESSSFSSQVEKDAGEVRDERSQLAASPTPTRVKLVRTNFSKAEKPDEPAIEVNPAQVSKSLSKENETTTIRVETNIEKQKEITEDLELKSVTKSKALQIISCNYDSDSNESSQEGDSSLAVDSKTPVDSTSLDKPSETKTSAVSDSLENLIESRTPADSDLSDKQSDSKTLTDSVGPFDKLSEVGERFDCKEDLESELLLNSAGPEKETPANIDGSVQEGLCLENTESKAIPLIECTKTVDENTSEMDQKEKCDNSNLQSLINKSNIDGTNTPNASKSENIVCEDVESLGSSLSEIGLETSNNDQTNIDCLKLNVEMNKIKIEDKKKTDDLEKQQAIIVDNSKDEKTESTKAPEDVNSCVASDSNLETLVETLEIAADGKKEDDGKDSDEISSRISQSDKVSDESEGLSETFNSTKNVVTCKDNSDDENQDWVIISHEDVKEIISEEPVKSKTFDTSDNLQTLKVNLCREEETHSESKSPEKVLISEEISNLKPEEERDVTSPGQNYEPENLADETNVGDENLECLTEDSQTNDYLTESSSKYSDKVDETMEEIFSEHLESSSIPEDFEKESNDGVTKSLESEKTNEGIITFEGMIETDKNHHEQISGPGDQETNETLLEMLESDNSPITTDVPDVTLENIVQKDILPEDEKIELSLSTGVSVEKSADETTVSDVKVSKEPGLVESVTCTLTAAVDDTSSIDRNLCYSEKTETNLKEMECLQIVKKKPTVETIESNNLTETETQPDKDVKISESCIGSVVNKLHNITTEVKLVEEIEQRDIVTKSAKNKEDSALEKFDNDDRVQVIEKENISTEETAAGEESLETKELTSIICIESTPSTVAGDEKLDSDEIKKPTLLDSDESKGETVMKNVLDVRHEEHIETKDQTLGNSNNLLNSDVNNEIAHIPEEYTASIESSAEQNIDIGKEDIVSRRETSEVSGKFLGSSNIGSLSGSESIIDNTEDVTVEENKIEDAGNKLGDISKQLVTDNVKCRDFVTAEPSQKLEHAQVEDGIATNSKNIDNETLKSPTKKDELLEVSKVDCSEQKESSKFTTAKIDEIKTDDVEKTSFLSTENSEQSTHGDKTATKNITGQNIEPHKLQECDISLNKAESAVTLGKDDILVDHTKEDIGTSSTETNNGGGLFEQHIDTSNQVPTKSSINTDNLPSISEDIPSFDNSTVSKIRLSEKETEKEPTKQGTTVENLEKLEKHSSLKDTEDSISIDKSRKFSEKVISEPPTTSCEQLSQSKVSETSGLDNVKVNQSQVGNASPIDSSEPETVEAIDSFLKQTESPKEEVEVIKSSVGPPSSAKTLADVLCELDSKIISDAKSSADKTIEKDSKREGSDQLSIDSLKNSSNTIKDTLEKDSYKTACTNKDIQESADSDKSLKLNITKISAGTTEVSKNVKVQEKSVEPLKLKLKKTDYEVYSPKRSESPVESPKVTIKLAENKQRERTGFAGMLSLEKDKEIKKQTSVASSKPVHTTDEESRSSATSSDANVELISKKDATKKDVIKKSTSDRSLTTKETLVKPDVTENLPEEKVTLLEHQTKRSAESIVTDGSSDSSTAKSSRKKLKRSQTEPKTEKEDSETLKEDAVKGEILPDLSLDLSQTISSSQVAEPEMKQSPKATPKEIPPPVRVSARQKQRQAVAAALAAEEKSKEGKPVENVAKKTTFQEKAVDKRAKKSVSPTKEIGLKTLFVKTTETAKQSCTTSEKSPKLMESKSLSPVSPKKVVKELGQEKLEPITLKLSKEDNPVIIRSSSLSPKKVLSPQSPQQKSLGYTLKIGKDSATIVPKDPAHSPKLREASPSVSSSKADTTNKVGYLIKDTGLTITPVSPAETQEQKLNKITLKLSKAGGHPEIKQEKAETWKAIKKLGEVDIVPMEGKVTAESSKRKEKSDQGSPEKKMKLGDLTIEPSTSSGLSKLQGLLTQAPLNKAESSEDIQFVGFGSPAEKSQPVEKVQYDIGLVKPEDELSMPKKRGRPRKITSPSDMVHSVTHSGLAGSKSILAASLQHPTVQQRLHQQQHLQIQESLPMMAPQEDADSSIPMFPVPLFDLSEDTFMEPHPTIFPDQVQPENIIMRSARGRPIGRSRRPRGSGLARGERGGPRGRPRGSRGIKKILEEMEFLSYPDMEQPITLDNIDAEIPRILEPPVSHITEKTMALLRKSIECKKESLEKKRKSDGSDSDNKDSELDAKVKEMKEKIEAAYKAELESPGKEDKEATKRTPEKAEIKEAIKKSPEPIPSCSTDVVKTATVNKGSKRKSTEENAPFHGIGQDILKRKLSEEKIPERRNKRKSTDEMSVGKGKDKNESKKLKVPSVQSDQKPSKRKSLEEKPESNVKVESEQAESTKTIESTDELSDKADVQVNKEDTVVKASEEMEVDKPSLTEQPATETDIKDGAEKEKVTEPEVPAKPVKPKPKSKAEIKRIKREKDRLRREAKKLAALEALKAPPPNPSEEDTRMSASDMNGDGYDDGFGFKKNRMEVGDPEGKEFCVEYIAEYQWPLQGGELYMIQEQISTYLGVKSFKRKYPDIKRRPVEMEERTYLCDSGLVSESMCDLGLTAVSSSEVLDIMFQDFPDQYEELRKNMRDKAARELINKQKEKKKFEQSLSKSDLKEHAIQSAQSWNQALNRSRNESRRCHLDLQTWTVQYPRSRGAKMTRPTPKLGNYPLALIPGQYSDYCKRYTPQELRYWPINTVLYGPLQPNERNSTGGSDGSQSESEDSSSSDDSSESSSDGEGTEEEERDCKVCGGGGRKGGEATVRCSQCAHHIHISCADLKAAMLVHLHKYPWQCSVCKTCQRCNNSNNESKMLFCDLCDRGYHSYCVGLRRVPAGSWTCQLCTDS